jgi:hypothetical protein
MNISLVQPSRLEKMRQRLTSFETRGMQTRNIGKLDAKATAGGDKPSGPEWNHGVLPCWHQYHTFAREQGFGDYIGRPRSVSCHSDG